jgi:2-iminoacetate synthase
MSTFSEIFDQLPIDALVQQSLDTSNQHLSTVLKQGSARNLRDFAALISPQASSHLETMAAVSQSLTQKHFGKVIRLFAPLYLSNECVNICKYCGFSRNNKIPRNTLPLPQVVKEVEMLSRQGFRSLLLVAGEHPKFVSNGYVAEVIRASLPLMPSIALELGPLETEDYIPLVQAGTEGLIVYQETYHEPTYRALHTAGPKKDYRWRMDTPERAYQAGFRRIGISALYGLYDWRYEAIAVAAHARHLLQHCWKAQISISFPRMRPAAGGFQPKEIMSDRELVQLLTAFRWLLPHASITLSTRESAALRDGLVTLGVTNMSAGSSTEPGGYSHFDESSWTPTQSQPGEQFHIADERSPAQISNMIRSKGYDPVWKDFECCLVSETV